MARTTITKEPFPTNTPLTEEVLAWTNADAVNGNQFAYTGRDILLVWNSSGSAARNFTPQSAAINGREDPKDNVAQSVPIGQYRLYNYRAIDGWKQSDGFVYIDGDNAELRFIVITLPA